MKEGNNRLRSFPETRWSLILRVSTGDSDERRRALSEICSLYWPPVYSYFRSQGRSPHDSEDLTQGLFAQLLEKDDFSGADPVRGKLRSYLLTSAKHYLASEMRHSRRQKRGGEAFHFSIDAGEAESRCHIPELVDSLTPEKIFDRQWATTLLESVVRTLEAGYQRRKNSALYERLKPFLTGSVGAGEQTAIAEKLGMSEAALRVAIHRLRQRYGKALREAVLDTLAEGEDAEGELRHLMMAFS